ncbi:MAG: TetR/AcrR family transcriptional regulator, partial [bacterium]|nr:TetR/AcrR family transcriptional regulator [bacterium]
MITRKEQAENKKNAIIAASLELFFEKGYETTSIRMIQDKVESTPGLFYHYFESKDKVFDEAIKLFFKSYEDEMQMIVDDTHTHTKGALKRYIEYIFDATIDFRKKYLLKLHWTILGAIREYTVRLMRKYIFDILSIYREKNIIDIDSDRLEMISNLIAFGVGGSILYQDGDTFTKQKQEIY